MWKEEEVGKGEERRTDDGGREERLIKGFYVDRRYEQQIYLVLRLRMTLLRNLGHTCKFTRTVLPRPISGLTVNIVAQAFTAADPLGSGGINLMPMHFSRAKLWCMLILKQGLDGLLSCQ